MDKAIITLLVLAAVIGLSCQQDRCLYSRLDYIPCIYRNKNLRRAEVNQLSIHHTRLRLSRSGFLTCNVRPVGQQIQDISNLGTRDMRILYSPGFVIEESYDNQLLVEYKVQCEAGQLAFFNVTKLNVQGDGDCKDRNGNKKCQDYIIINRGSFGTTEICGNTISTDSELELQSNEFTVQFRTSEETRGSGFQMYAICFEQMEMNLEGCFEPADFNTSVCIDGGSSSGLPVDDSKRRRRAPEESSLTYGNLFQGYPSGLKMRKDVAKFHSRWIRQRRQSEGLQFFRRNIFFNESVNYTDNTITVFDSDNETQIQYKNILILQTFNALGETTNFIGRVTEKLNPHFFGPGPLVVIGRNAYFQLFVIDPRGLVPNEEEEQDLIAMNQPLLDANHEDFNVTDPDQTIDSFDEIFGAIGGKRKRQVEAFSEVAFFTALRNLEACNPVLRSQARSTLQVFETNFPEAVIGLRNFTISCNNASTLNCTVDDGFAPALDKQTTCEISGQQVSCDPFYNPTDLSENGAVMVASVIVRAVNCNGQRVEHIQMIT